MLQTTHHKTFLVSYSTVVLHSRDDEVWAVIPKNINQKPASLSFTTWQYWSGRITPNNAFKTTPNHFNKFLVNI